VTIHAVAQAHDHGDELADDPFQVGESIPAICRVADMCRIFRLTRSGFHRRERRREFKQFELRGQGRKQWSGYRIATFLTGEPWTATVGRPSRHPQTR